MINHSSNPLSESVKPNNINSKKTKKHGQVMILALVGATIVAGVIMFGIIRRRRSCNQLPMEEELYIDETIILSDERLSTINDNKSGVPQSEVPQSEVPQSEAPQSEAPQSEVPPTSQVALHQNSLNTIMDRAKTFVINAFNMHDQDKDWKEIYTNKASTLVYNLKRKYPKQGDPYYISTTTYKNLPDIRKVKNYMVDNEYKKQHDASFKSATRLDFDADNNIEIWHIIREYSLVGEREYIIASKLWDAPDGSFFCVSKAYNHPKSRTINKDNLVEKYLSGWQISKVKDSQDCQVKLFHTEDLKSSLVKRFANSPFSLEMIWKYVLQIERLLREYQGNNN